MRINNFNPHQVSLPFWSLSAKKIWGSAVNHSKSLEWPLDHCQHFEIGGSNFCSQFTVHHHIQNFMFLFTITQLQISFMVQVMLWLVTCCEEPSWSKIISKY